MKALRDMNKYPWWWSAKQHARWATLRGKGKKHFVLMNGVVGWGLPMFGIMGLGPVLSGHIHPRPGYFIETVVVWGAAGLFFGVSTWCWCERLFKKFETRSSAQADSSASGGPTV